VVNNADGTPVTATRAMIRTLFLHLNVWSIVGVLCGMIRKDRRELHDIIAGTGVVYSWDAGMARYRQKVIDESQWVETTNFINNSSTSAAEVEDRSPERRTLSIEERKRPNRRRRLQTSIQCVRRVHLSCTYECCLLFDLISLSIQSRTGIVCHWSPHVDGSPIRQMYPTRESLFGGAVVACTF
jgi:hypothetical protein